MVNGEWLVGKINGKEFGFKRETNIIAIQYNHLPLTAAGLI
jgi:hypothetical protein